MTDKTALERMLDEYLDTGTVDPDTWREMARELHLNPEARKGSLLAKDATGRTRAVFTPGWTPRAKHVSGVGGSKAGRVSGQPVYDPGGTEEYEAGRTHRDCGHPWSGHRPIRDGFSCDYCTCRLITRLDRA